jgi:hypothetical protein
VSETEGLCGIDLGFTPATNLNPVRRLSLEVRQAADATAAWLDPSDWHLKRFVQQYERTGTRPTRMKHLSSAPKTKRCPERENVRRPADLD